MNMNMREMREYAEGFGVVSNAERMREAVPFVVAASRRLAEIASTVKQVRKAVDELAERAGRYALQHPGAFDAGRMETSPIGVLSGDVTIGGSVYHFASGFGPVVREDGDKLTQEFLMGLPKEWTKAETKLDMTAIMSKYGKGDKLGEALQEKGLVRSVKNQWGIKVEAATAEDCDE